jgi:hypothetical protein
MEDLKSNRKTERTVGGILAGMLKCFQTKSSTRRLNSITDEISIIAVSINKRENFGP